MAEDKGKVGQDSKTEAYLVRGHVPNWIYAAVNEALAIAHKEDWAFRGVIIEDTAGRPPIVVYTGEYIKELAGTEAQSGKQES